MPYKFDGNTGVTGGKERQLPDFSSLMSAEERQAWMSQTYDREIPVSMGSLPKHVRDVRDVRAVAVNHNQFDNRADNTNAAANTKAIDNNQFINQTENVFAADDNYDYGNGPENVMRTASAVHGNRSYNQLENPQRVIAMNDNHAQNQFEHSQNFAADGNQFGNHPQNSRRVGSANGNHPSAHRRFRGNHDGNTRQPSHHGNNNRVSKSQSIRFKSGPHAEASNVSGVEFSIEEVESTDIDWRRRANKLEEENAALKIKFENLMAELQKLRGEKAQITEELEKMTAGYQKLQNTHTRDHYRSFDEILDLTQKLRISEQKCAILEERYNNILNGVRGY